MSPWHFGPTPEAPAEGRGRGEGGSGLFGGVDGREDAAGVVADPGMLDDILEAEPQGRAVAQQPGDQVPRAVRHDLREAQVHLRGTRMYTGHCTIPRLVIRLLSRFLL